MMDEIKNPVPNQSSGHQPVVCLESQYGKQQKNGRTHNFSDEYAAWSSHRGKQHLVEADHDQHGGIECPLTVKANHGSQSSHCQSQARTYQIFHSLSSTGNSPSRNASVSQCTGGAINIRTPVVNKTMHRVRRNHSTGTRVLR